MQLLQSKNIVELLKEEPRRSFRKPSRSLKPLGGAEKGAENREGAEKGGEGRDLDGAMMMNNTFCVD